MSTFLLWCHCRISSISILPSRVMSIVAYLHPSRCAAGADQGDAPLDRNSMQSDASLSSGTMSMVANLHPSHWRPF